MTTTFIGTTRSGNVAIAPEGMGAIQQLLSSTAYAHPKRAVLREYVANGIDAQLRIGVTAPIEVSLPSFQDPVLTVTDHGSGMSLDEVIERFGPFGASSKRSDSSMTGEFGIGAKAGYAVADSFLVRSTKDARTCEVLFCDAASGDDTKTWDVLADRPATPEEQQGTTITLHVPDQISATSAWENDARAAFSWLDPSLVEILELPDIPGSLRREATPLPDGSCWTTHRGRYGSILRIDSVIVMGSIAYPVTPEQLRSWGLPSVMAGVYLAIPVPGKSIDVLPSREGLRDTERTNDFMRRRIAQLVAAYADYESEILDALDSPEQIFGSDSDLPRRCISLREAARTKPNADLPVRWRGRVLANAVVPVPGVNHGYFCGDKTTWATVMDLRACELLAQHRVVIENVSPEETNAVKRMITPVLKEHVPDLFPDLDLAISGLRVLLLPGSFAEFTDLHDLVPKRGCAVVDSSRLREVHREIMRARKQSAEASPARAVRRATARGHLVELSCLWRFQPREHPTRDLADVIHGIRASGDGFTDLLVIEQKNLKDFVANSRYSALPLPFSHVAVVRSLGPITKMLEQMDVPHRILTESDVDLEAISAMATEAITDPFLRTVYSRPLTDINVYWGKTFTDAIEEIFALFDDQIDEVRDPYLQALRMKQEDPAADIGDAPAVPLITWLLERPILLVCLHSNDWWTKRNVRTAPHLVDYVNRLA